MAEGLRQQRLLAKGSLGAELFQDSLLLRLYLPYAYECIYIKFGDFIRSLYTTKQYTYICIYICTHIARIPWLQPYSPNLYPKNFNPSSDSVTSVPNLYSITLCRFETTDTTEYTWDGQTRSGQSLTCFLVNPIDPTEYCVGMFKHTKKEKARYEDAIKKFAQGKKFKMYTRV